MFKVVDNADGSTTVYSKTNGAFICMVPNRTKPMAFGLPIPRPSNSVVNANSMPKVSTEDLSRIVSSPSSSFTKPVLKHEEANTDYYEDCITNEQFMQALGLVNKKKYDDTPIEKLKLEFPYRQISKCNLTSIDVNTKFFNKIGVSSQKSQTIMNLKHCSSRFLINQERIDLLRKKQDSFVKTGVRQTSLNKDMNSPALRMRDNTKLNYPITYFDNKEKRSSHTYAFNRAQRWEKVVVRKTGLTKRSRKLLERCKKCSVSVKKLSFKDIKRINAIMREATKKKNIPQKIISVQAFINKKAFGMPFKTNVHEHPGMMHVIEKFHHYADFLSGFQLSNQTSLCLARKMSNGLRFSKKHAKNVFSSRVVLHDVLEDLVQKLNASYFKDSSIVSNGIHILPTVVFNNKKSLPANTSDHSYCSTLPLSKAPCIPNGIRPNAPTQPLILKRKMVLMAQPKQPLLPLNQIQYKYMTAPLSTLNRAAPNNKLVPLPPSTSYARYLPVLPRPVMMPSTALHPARISSAQRSALTVQVANQYRCPAPPPIQYCKPLLKLSENVKVIPVIDLSGDDDEKCEKSFPETNKSRVQFTFHCYGCNSRSIFTTEDEAKRLIKTHMIEYHSVLEPDLFLQETYDKVTHTTRFIAFPGFKSSNKG